jgi:2-keto-4-pentenoate hydratase/2-oxohepta-3-ene-1,7-dioic acid hydratase in catechol pathway
MRLATIRTGGGFLLGGETVVTEIEGIGRLENRVVKDDPR